MKYINKIFSSLIMVLALFLVGCNEDLIEDKENIGLPTITDFSPKTGKVGTEITITGENLQKIDSVWIGGQLSEVKYRVNPREVVVSVTANSKTGKILISGSNGKAETSENFTLNYTVPQMTTFPTSGKVGDEIYIEGNNLDAVMSVYFGATEATIISKSEKDMVVKVPFTDENNVDIVLNYNTEAGTTQTGTTGKPFSLVKELPVVDAGYPTTAEAGSMFTITGSNLSVINEVWFGDYQASISGHTETSLTISVPTGFTSVTTVPLKLVYYGTKEMVLTDAFRVTLPNLAKIYFWENVTIYAQDPSNTGHFFNATTGEVYSPCDYAGVKNNIYFFITNSSSSIQINNPNNSDQQLKNFKCDGVALPVEKAPNIVKFRRLDPTMAAQSALITKVKDKTLESITQDEIVSAEIPNAGTSAIRYYGNPDTNMYAVGDVLLFQQFDAAGTVLKVGFLHITNITTTNAATDKASSITFNCYFQK